MSKSILVIGLFLLTSSLQAQDTWVVDPAHSSITFKVEHLVISEVVGSFGEFSGELTMEGEDFTSSIIKGKIGVRSIETGNKQRDGHLMAPDFFDATAYPEIIFNSKSIEKSDGHYRVVGSLTMKGITKEIIAKVDYKGTVQFMGQTKAGIKLTTTIDRFAYGLNWNAMLEAGGAVVGREVDITLNMELVKQ